MRHEPEPILTMRRLAHVRLSALTSYRIGGSADMILEVTSVSAMCDALAYLQRHTPSAVLPLGVGSNVLAPDDGSGLGAAGAYTMAMGMSPHIPARAWISVSTTRLNIVCQGWRGREGYLVALAVPSEETRAPSDWRSATAWWPFTPSICGNHHWACVS